VTYAEFSRKLRALGCVLKRQGKGSHEIWHNPSVNRSAVIPNHAETFQRVPFAPF
jgi:predicted RNA binding protein YcfA (HicA-like mRNA interferase family)